MMMGGHRFVRGGKGTGTAVACLGIACVAKFGRTVDIKPGDKQKTTMTLLRTRALHDPTGAVVPTAWVLVWGCRVGGVCLGPACVSLATSAVVRWLSKCCSPHFRVATCAEHGNCQAAKIP